MLANIIFIGGIHGVGKGSLCSKICKEFSFKHLSASDVLKWDEISERKNKKVRDIDSTQSRLINGLSSLINTNLKYVLDGHFCLLNENGKPEKIPKSVFYKIKPKAIVVLTCDIELIISRLKNRDNTIYERSLLLEMQTLELYYGKEIAAELSIPFLEIEDGNYHELVELLRDT